MNKTNMCSKAGNMHTNIQKQEKSQTYTDTLERKHTHKHLHT